MKKFSLFLCLFLLLAACSHAENKTSRTEFVFGTVVTITVYGDNKTAENTVDAAFARLAEIEGICSYTMPDSELSRLNASGSMTVSGELYALIEKSLDLCEETRGAFDITLGELIDLWGEQTVPSDGDIKAVLPYIGFENVVLSDNNAVIFKNGHIKLHLGGIAKGYAADELVEIFGRFGVNGAVADLGGDILLYGDSPRKDGVWRVGIADPLKESETADIISVKSGFVMTSGNYERYFEQNGVRYHHIFDRETGYPTVSGAASATVYAGLDKSGLACDAYATALFAFGNADFLPEGFDFVLIDEKES